MMMTMMMIMMIMIALVVLRLTRYNVFYRLFSGTDDEDRIGTSYIRWGRKTCQSNATLVYKGTFVRRPTNNGMEKK